MEVLLNVPPDEFPQREGEHILFTPPEQLSTLGICQILLGKVRLAALSEVSPTADGYYLQTPVSFGIALPVDVRISPIDPTGLVCWERVELRAATAQAAAQLRARPALQAAVIAHLARSVVGTGASVAIASGDGSWVHCLCSCFGSNGKPTTGWGTVEPTSTSVIVHQSIDLAADQRSNAFPLSRLVATPGWLTKRCSQYFDWLVCMGLCTTDQARTSDAWKRSQFHCIMLKGAPRM